MQCACGGMTAVIETRDIVRAGVGLVRRRRRCGTCGVRFTTYEASEKSIAGYARAKERNAARRRRQRAALPPEERAAAFKRVYLRRKAREEAAETGAPVAEVYERWGIK